MLMSRCFASVLHSHFIQEGRLPGPFLSKQEDGMYFLSSPISALPKQSILSLDTVEPKNYNMA
jgi:hypothetical protein